MEEVRRMRILLLVALTALAAPAFPETPGSRQEALAALASAEAETRAAAVVWIARHGAEADAAAGTSSTARATSAPATFRPGGIYLILIRWPLVSWNWSRPGFSSWRRSTGTPVFSAMA